MAYFQSVSLEIYEKVAYKFFHSTNANLKFQAKNVFLVFV